MTNRHLLIVFPHGCAGARLIAVARGRAEAVNCHDDRSSTTGDDVAAATLQWMLALGVRRGRSELRMAQQQTLRVRRDQGPVARRSVVLAGLCATPLMGFSLSVLLGESRIQQTLIASIALVLAAPLIERLAHRTFDPFEPITLFAAVWAFMFVVGPIAMIDDDTIWLRGTYEVSAGMTAALAAGFIGAVAFVAGYELMRRRSFHGPPTLKEPPSPWLAVATTGVALATMAAQTGLDLASAAAANGAYFYLAPLLSVPAILMWLHRGRSAAGVALTLVSAAYFLSFGQRAFVLWPIVAITVWWYLAHERRPSGVRVALVSFIVVLPLFAALAVAREQQISPLTALKREEVLKPDLALELIATGETNAMVAALALQMESENTSWVRRPGYELASTLATWIPRRLWTDKPVNSPELLYSQFFPDHYEINKAGTVFTLTGEFYYDSGYLGVALGLMLVGGMSGWLWAWIRSRQHDPSARALYAPAVVLALVLYRGGVSLTLGLGLFIFGPLLVARRAAGSSTPERGRPGVTLE